MPYPKLKRAFDVICSGVGLLVLLPPGLLIALLIKLSDGGPVFYGQKRIGRFGKPFRIWKFRSMVVNADKMGVPLTRDQDPRITGIGRFLRKTKLDELPQLWNVLIGDMSLVGPRPEVPRYVELYTPEQRQILIYKPGITDVARNPQIVGVSAGVGTIGINTATASITGNATVSATEGSTFASSSITMMDSSSVSPAPPRSSGQVIPMNPSVPNVSISGKGNSCDSSYCITTGRISFSANSLATCWIASNI